MPAPETSLSPYIRLHKDDLVQWQDWDAQTLARAETENKPVMLSSGYSGCYWCHVMSQESFRDPETAGLINDNFVPVLIDREERPDLDQLYQSALPAIGLNGGWPLIMFLTPEGAPFFVANYMPKEERLGQPSFKTALNEAIALWQERNEQARGQAAHVKSQMDGFYGADLSAPPETVQLDVVALRTAQTYDIFFGGQLGTPKFPLVCQLEMIWRAFLRTGVTPYSQIFFNTMDHILFGSLYDHVGGGFFRYCYDERWIVPHFEKTLADNAQLIELLTQVWQFNRSELARVRVEESIAWLLREMKLPGGGFASNLSAGAGQEGEYYLWTEAEVDAALVGTFSAKFKAAYEVSRDGNFSGRNVLRRLSLASEPTSDADEALFTKQRGLLLEARRKRALLLRDDKLTADWNGLMIAALAQAGAVFDRADWMAEAVAAFNAVIGTLGEGAGLRHAAHDGKVSQEGYADDYANMALAALQLYEVSGDKRFLDNAKAWVETLDSHYWDEARGGYFYTSDNAGPLLLRPRFFTDNPAPPANATMLTVLSRLILMTGDAKYVAHAPRVLRAFSREVPQGHRAMAAFLNGAETYSTALQVVIFGQRGQPQTQELIRTVWGKAVPGRLMLVVEPGESLPEGHPCAGQGMQNGQPTAYVCQGSTRAGPITSPVVLSQLLTLPQQLQKKRQTA